MNEDALLEKTWHHSRFSDIGRLVSLKEQKGLKISLAFPTLNEEATIGKEILVMRTELMDRYPLLDEIAVIDSSSTDNTRKVAERFGAKVFESKGILPNYGTFRGKGENLWKSLYVLEGDIIVWVDADISNIAPKFVYGLIGPLLEDDETGYVKAFYERPIRSSGGISSTGGGRVTEILVRPLFSLFYPELARLIQPLSGEYSGRRSLLEQLSFSVGYGVELGHLIDILEIAGINALAQVDLDLRIHRNQTTAALGKMAYGIINTFLARTKKYGAAEIMQKLGDRHIALEMDDAGGPSGHRVLKSEIPSVERPPIIEIPEYREKFKKV
ncbi:glycosyltransferase, family 2 [Treponema primitia ZAS-2]|uniref:Glycosyltransferase, family 2 n=1 Tax=Treponema primitia (strain ATCC BAA-887 / DSM 12427 / ZAS-2) TaxID=545694 RepID=F5YNR5_TREPZ|nr:glucosyl-3-phosphoglycerate synthase [Treponema primitia]AEF83869.1 glycosyltransferase, family 2 [Treponema primitia ZAS-2]